MKEFRLTAIIALPAEAFAEATALVAIRPIVAAFLQALDEAKIPAKVEHEVVSPRSKKAAKPSVVVPGPRPAA